MKTQTQIIENTVKSLYVQGVIKRKGWTERHAALMVVDYIMCGEKISLHDFLEAAE